MHADISQCLQQFRVFFFPCNTVRQLNKHHQLWRQKIVVLIVRVVLVHGWNVVWCCEKGISCWKFVRKDHCSWTPDTSVGALISSSLSPSSTYSNSLHLFFIGLTSLELLMSRLFFTVPSYIPNSCTLNNNCQGAGWLRLVGRRCGGEWLPEELFRW